MRLFAVAVFRSDTLSTSTRVRTGQTGVLPWLGFNTAILPDCGHGGKRQYIDSEEFANAEARAHTGDTFVAI